LTGKVILMGVGKNMVRAIRFWSLAANVVEHRPNEGYFVTEFGEDIFGNDGLDPYLEDIKTLWLLHWNFSTQIEEPLFAWDFLLNKWQEPDISRSSVLRVFQQEPDVVERKLSLTTLSHHFDTFIHTYVPTRGPKGIVKEDNLDSPLVELELIQKIGEQEIDINSGKREPIYAFRREEKLDISPELFVYCLYDFFQRRHPTENTLSFREISIGHGSPGQIFKIPEIDLRERLYTLETQTDGLLSFQESANIQQIRKHKEVSQRTLLELIFSLEMISA